MHRFHFNSVLKRMSTVVECERDGGVDSRCGGPEGAWTEGSERGIRRAVCWPAGHLPHWPPAARRCLLTTRPRAPAWPATAAPMRPLLPRSPMPRLPHERSWWVLSKGAPEVMQPLLAAVPPHYEACYKVGLDGPVAVGWGGVHGGSGVRSGQGVGLDSEQPRSQQRLHGHHSIAEPCPSTTHFFPASASEGAGVLAPGITDPPAVPSPPLPLSLCCRIMQPRARACWPSLTALRCPPPNPLPPQQKYASEGARVLALAYRQLDSLMTPSELRHLPRDAAESQLTFAGGSLAGRSRRVFHMLDVPGCAALCPAPQAWRRPSPTTEAAHPAHPHLTRPPTPPQALPCSGRPSRRTASPRCACCASRSTSSS